VIQDIASGIYPPEAIMNVIGKHERKKIASSKNFQGETIVRRPDSRLIFYGDLTFSFLEEMFFGDY
jgi:hypothetical protein